MRLFGVSKKELRREVARLQRIARDSQRELTAILELLGWKIPPVTGDPGIIVLEGGMKGLEFARQAIQELKDKCNEAVDVNGAGYKRQLEAAYAVIDKMVEERGFTVLYQLGLRCPSNFDGVLSALILSLKQDKEKACGKLQSEINKLHNEIPHLG